ncbi:hypothetical protein AB0G00_23950 [Nocardia salmonicida]|uniref:hypothetical protein n=1 Tax=Nocardia salmonicida TaxID=53431 RepID=UPI0033D20938
MPEIKITTAADVTAEILEAAESLYDGRYDDGEGCRVDDWEDFIYRLETNMSLLVAGVDYEFGDSMLSPAIKKIQRHINAYRKL